MLKSWVSIIKAYNDAPDIHEDWVFQNYEKDIHERIKILDTDADKNSFDTERQVWLKGYLDKIIEKIEQIKNDENQNEASTIIADSKELQRQLPTSSKNVVIKQLSKILAHCAKFGLDVIKELFIEYSAELTKRLLTQS